MNIIFKQIGWVALFIAILCHSACLDPTANSFDKSEGGQKSLVINEIVARAADGGNDWIELYNATENALFLRYYALVDDNPEREPVPLPDMILEPGGFIVIQATDEAPEDGSFYVPFGLGVDDCVALYQDSDIMDVLDWEDGDAPDSYSFGRLPDGTENVQILIPTQGQANKSIELFVKGLIARDLTLAVQ